MSTLDILMLSISALICIAVPVLLYLHRRFYVDPLKRSIEWQLEKSRRLGEGWLPYAYREGLQQCPIIERPQPRRDTSKLHEQGVAHGEKRGACPRSTGGSGP